MQEVNEDEVLIRRFLLDELGEDERQRIEEHFITDGGYRAGVLIAEDELIEEYLEGTLSAGERERFRAHYLTTPQQRQKLQIAKAIKKRAAVGVATASPSVDEVAPQPNTERRDRINRPSLRSPLIALPLAAALLLAFGFGALKLIETWRWNKQQAEEQAHRAADEQELAQLNDRAQSGQQRTTGNAFSIIVPPVATRGVAAAKLLTPSDASPVELLLLLEGEEYPSYQVALQKVGSAQRRTVRHLRAENSPTGRIISLLVPARLLTRGDYQLKLAGVTSAGALEELGEYALHVTDQ